MFESWNQPRPNFNLPTIQILSSLAPSPIPLEQEHTESLMLHYHVARANVKPKRVLMRMRSVLRIAAGHLLLYIFVVGYIIGGGYLFHNMEGEKEYKLHEMQRERVTTLRDEVVTKISRTTDVAVKRWTFQSSILYSFTILTTIGYGNVAPTTPKCQVFTMLYGAFGIPLFLIAIADLGRFTKTGIVDLIQYLTKKELKKQGDHRFWRELGEVLLVAVIFVLFIACGSAVLPLWENQLSYFDSVYFSYMSLTTIGLGDIVPRRMDFLLPTLIYITIGLWLTTALVEQLADVFRLLHYAGRKVSNVKGITVWLGGRRISVGGLIQTVCRRVGMSDQLMDTINWERTLDNALDGIQPAAIPIFPWHFADFLEKDPPLIDLSIDLDQMENQRSRTFQGSFYCSRGPSKRRRDSQLSAPPLPSKWKYGSLSPDSGW